MKHLKEFYITEDEISKGGLADGMSLQDIADKHDVDIDRLRKEYNKGLEVEMEHTDNEELAQEIAKDHLFEDPEYYTKLATIEESKIKKGSIVKIHPDWLDSPEEADTRYEVVNVNSSTKKVQIRPVDSDLSIPPIETVKLDMLITE